MKTTWYMGEQKQTEIKWVYGEQHGKAEGWYKEGGQPMSVSHWENGKLDGRVLIEYENGQKKERGSLVKGRPGLAKTWYQNGQKVVGIEF